jgi:hypothetical protein
MFYDMHRHGYEPASQSNFAIADGRQYSADAIEAAVPEREARRVMDALLRECLQRKPLG